MIHNFIVTILKEYLDSIIVFCKQYVSPNMEETNVSHNGDKYQVKYNDRIYLLYNKNRFFFGGNIDDGDFQTTLENDFKTFGMVISALAHLDDRNYLDVLWKDKIVTFVNQLEYVLGYCMITLPGGNKIQIKDLLDKTEEFSNK